MKRYLFLLPLLATQALFAQWTVRLHQKLPTDQHIHLRPWGDGYVGIGGDSPMLPEPGTTNRFYHENIAFVRLLDRDLNVRKELRFPQSKQMIFHYAHPTEKFIYLTGETEVDQKPRLACLDRNLNLLWDRSYTLPGGARGDRLGATVMPDGDLIGSTIGVSKSRTVNGVYYLRISPSGDVKWIVNPVKGRWNQYAFVQPVMLADGNLMIAGYNFRSSDPETYQGWDLRVLKLDYATGTVLWEKAYALPGTWMPGETMPGDPKVVGGLLLPNGDLAFTGSYGSYGVYSDYFQPGVNIVRERNMVLVMSPEGDIRSLNVWRKGDLAKLEDVQACSDGRYRTCSINRTNYLFGHEDRLWTEIVTWDERMQLLASEPVDVKGFNLDHRTRFFEGVGGDYILSNPYEIAILRPR